MMVLEVIVKNYVDYSWKQIRNGCGLILYNVSVQSVDCVVIDGVNLAQLFASVVVSLLAWAQPTYSENAQAP